MPSFAGYLLNFSTQPDTAFILGYFSALGHLSNFGDKVTGQAVTTAPTQGFISEPEQLPGTLTGPRVG